jgi:hypothetical protein
VLPMRRLDDDDTRQSPAGWRAALRSRRPLSRGSDEVPETRPWGLIVFSAAFALYIGLRLIQMLVWGVQALL